MFIITLLLKMSDFDCYVKPYSNVHIKTINNAYEFVKKQTNLDAIFQNQLLNYIESNIVRYKEFEYSPPGDYNGLIFKLVIVALYHYKDKFRIVDLLLNKCIQGLKSDINKCPWKKKPLNLGDVFRFACTDDIPELLEWLIRFQV